MAPEVLAEVLKPMVERFPAGDHPALLVGLAEGDDAAVYRIDDNTAVIQTLDFFTPVVDDPYEYGSIAAANAMSDVYAMGGEVVLALNICGFPSDLDPEIMQAILRGGADKVAEAGGVLAGGHTVCDPEPKYGLAVMGLVHPEGLFTNNGARSGDRLLLTKPLGTGLITTAAKGDAALPEHLADAVTSMQQLNRDAARLLREAGVICCTDVTGFSLLGHGLELADGSGVRLNLHFDRLPLLPGTHDYAADWFFPAGSCHNQTCFEPQVEFAANIGEEKRMLLFTPETSGGLLAAVPSEQLEKLQERFEAAGHLCAVVGEVTDGEGIAVA